jgi:glyoxylase-like metal-dependent hydrolase (beta-lactamase superfamily II)
VSPDAPAVTELGHQIAQIRLPLPFPRLRWVNAFVLEGDAGLTLIDCGVDSEEGWQALASGLKALGRDMSEVGAVVGTHLHIDHMGMAGRIVAETGAKFVMHEAAPDGLAEFNDWSIGIDRQADIAAANGAPPEAVAEIREVTPRAEWASPAEAPTNLVAEGDRIPLKGDRYLDVLHTPGHDEAHICLVDSRTGVLFSGDHVLPRITPVVLYDPEGDRLGTYTESLQRIETEGFGLTYPAHGTVIERGGLRARQIILHHERRLGGIVQELRHGPRTAWEILEAIFRPNLLVFEKRLAFAETMAHLAHLVQREEVITFEEDGTTYYRKPPWRPSE